ncbi:hypothetical protein C1646_776947 [Rhizophagus diaphanus]|nr:hypothetical protein C1646_776947 [Rhizophagus diaphanus] [Rhizophagus sp. MUCL 43196]
MIIKFEQIINNLGIVLQTEAIWILYSLGFNEEDIGNRRVIREYVRLLKIYCEGRVNEINKAIVRERLREFIEEGGRTETAEWLERAQKIGDELKTFVMRELDIWLIQERKKKELENKSDDKDDGEEEIITSVYEHLAGTENELTKVDIQRILKLGFDKYEIIVDGFVREYKSIQEKVDKEVHRALYSHLTKRGIIRNPEEDDTDSQRTSEIEIIDQDEDEETSENNLSNNSGENIINTPTFGSSQNSDSNNSNFEDIELESDLSDIEILTVPIITMATEDQVRRILENALGFPNNALNAQLAPGRNLTGQKKTLMIGLDNLK